MVRKVGGLLEKGKMRLNGKTGEIRQSLSRAVAGEDFSQLLTALPERIHFTSMKP